MEEKVVVMALKVDLGCSRCYKKVKKVLSKFPQIRDQEYNEKQNMVIITVVCCKPEKIRDKIYCKGGESIKSIEIKEKPKAGSEKKKEAEKQKAAEPDKKKEPEKKKESEKTKEAEKAKSTTKTEAEPVKVPLSVPGYPPTAYPFGVCCGTCYVGHGGGTCYHGCGMPAPPPCYVGRPIYDSYGRGRCCYVGHCDYFGQENSTGCNVM